MQKTLKPLAIQIPDIAGVATLQFKVSAADGKVLHSNFMNFEILSEQEIPKVTVLSTPAASFTSADWSKAQWNVLEGLKVNGVGKGYFEYSIPVPEGTKSKGYKESYFMVEVSAKEYFVKDQKEYSENQDFMLGSQVAPSANPNSYPMTDETMFPSKISISINGKKVKTTTLTDDPADHRGILSWHHQLEKDDDRKLREAGSYGYLVKVPVDRDILASAVEKGELTVRLETEGEGGIAIYGKEFGRYMLDPSLVLKK